MSEGLKELEKLKYIEIDRESDGESICFIDRYYDEIKTIENELKELQEHEEILNDYNLTLANFREACLLLAQWKSAGLCWADYEKQKKALEIIKNKGVAVDELKEHSLELYNIYALENYLSILTQEEYDFLREVLKNE